MTPLSILLVGDYPDDPRLGSSKVFYKLREEFEAIGHTCDVLWTGDIGTRPASRQIRQLVSPWMAGKVIRQRMARRKCDVVDAASAEGWFSASSAGSAVAIAPPSSVDRMDSST